MSQLKWKLAALYCKDEATFATDPSANGSAYKHLKTAYDMTFTPSQDVVERSGLTNQMTRQAHVMGAKAGTVAFKLEVKGSGTAAVSTVAAIAAEADLILQAIFGTVTRGTGSLVVFAGSTASVVNVTAASGANFPKGSRVSFNCDVNGYCDRFVASVAGDALTLDRALPSVPANGTVVQSSSVYSYANTGQKSLAFVATKDTVQYTLLGCKIDSAKISGSTPRGTAMLDISCSVSDWSKTAKASLPTTDLAGITAVKGPVIKAACYAVGGTEEYAYGMELDFGPKFEYVDSTCALGPVQPDSVNAGVELVDRAIKGTVHPYYLDAHMTDFNAGTERSLAFSCPSTTPASSGNGWGFYIGKAQYGQPAFEEHNGMVGQTIPFMVNDNGTDPELWFSLA